MNPHVSSKLETQHHFANFVSSISHSTNLYLPVPHYSVTITRLCKTNYQKSSPTFQVKD